MTKTESMIKPYFNLLGAVVEKIENGENGIQPAIFIKTKDNQSLMITISNSHRFLIAMEGGKV